jgi:hypothetical protein
MGIPQWKKCDSACPRKHPKKSHCFCILGALPAILRVLLGRSRFGLSIVALVSCGAPRVFHATGVEYVPTRIFVEQFLEKRFGEWNQLRSPIPMQERFFSCAKT